MNADFYHFQNKLILSTFLLFCLLLSSYSFAQTGSISGHVYDKSTKAALPGANVVVKGTSFGAATDLDGKYIIHDIPAGSHTLVVSYIGYVSDSLKVEIYANKVLEQDFYLSTTAIQGKTVTITAQAQGQVGAIQEQLTSNKIVNVVSEARIQALPDFNAAQAISRLPGVSTTESSGEANKVVIRGLAPQYNQITIGGISLASTGSDQIGITSQGGTAGSIDNDRSVDLSMVSNYMIKNISVYKDLTPDMNANAIGGVVNMELREAPSELHADLLWQSGYTEKSNKYGNYRAVGSISKRFFDDNLGIYLYGDLESYDRNADDMDASYNTVGNTVGANGFRNVQVNTVTLDRHFETRKRYGANAILDYKLPSGSIEMVNMFSRLSSNYQDYNTIFNYYNSPNELDFQYSTGDNKVDLATNSLNFKYDFGFMSADITAANNYSRNNLPDAPQSLFTFVHGVGQSTVNTTPENLTAKRPSYVDPSNVYMSDLTLFSSDYKENDQTYKADFKVPLSVGQTITGYFKFGGEYSYNYHHNEQNSPYASIGGATPIQQAITSGIEQNFPGIVADATGGFPGNSFTTNNSDVLNSFLGDRFGKILWANNASLLTSMIHYIASNPQFNAINSSAVQPGGFFDGYYQILPNTYKYIEKYSAGYIMSQLNYDNLMIVGGVRYENDQGYYDAWNLKDGRDVASQQAYFVSSNPKNYFWLPMVQAKYNLTDWIDVRYAYTQTLARPAYSELSPHFTISYGNGAVYAANPNLVPAQAYNHDLIFTFHNNDIGLFTVDGFYKEIKNFSYATNYPLYDTSPMGSGIETTNDFNIGNSFPVKGATLFTYVNSPYIAYVKGLELDFQTRFWYLPSPFDGILLGINYTHIYSKTSYPFMNAKTTITGPKQSVTEVFDSTRTGRLIDQPNDIMNASIGYETGGFSGRFSFIFQGNSVSYIGNFPEQDGFTRNYFRIDASARQILPWYGIELYVDVNNLNNEQNISTQPSLGGFTNQQNYGLTADVGLRYRL
jgi:TonB-dependent receptor